MVGTACMKWCGFFFLVVFLKTLIFYRWIGSYRIVLSTSARSDPSVQAQVIHIRINLLYKLYISSLQLFCCDRGTRVCWVYVLLRGRDLDVMIGLGLFLNTIFWVSSATTSYSVPAWLVPLIDVSSFGVILCLLRTANGFSNATSFPVSRWWPMIRFGVPFASKCKSPMCIPSHATSSLVSSAPCNSTRHHSSIPSFTRITIWTIFFDQKKLKLYSASEKRIIRESFCLMRVLNLEIKWPRGHEETNLFVSNGLPSLLMAQYKGLKDWHEFLFQLSCKHLSTLIIL